MEVEVANMMVMLISDVVAPMVTGGRLTLCDVVMVAVLGVTVLNLSNHSSGSVHFGLKA